MTLPLAMKRKRNAGVACSREFALSLPSSHALAHARREHAELVAILRDRAPSDLYPTFLEDVHDRLVRERMLRVFLRHELLDLRLDATRRDVFARGGRKA